MQKTSRWESSIGLIGRGAALFLAGMGILALVGNLRGLSGLEHFWIDLRRFSWLNAWFLPAATAALALLGLGLGSAFGTWGRRLLAITLLITLGVVLENAWTVLSLQSSKAIGGSAMPSSLMVAALLVAAILALRSRPPIRARSRLGSLILAAFFAALFPWLQIQSFGQTDYRRPADAIVVFGARAYADGTPSRALADRVRTGCRLYRQGLARKLIVSGGPGDGEIHETESMRRLAIEEGVDPQDIVLDLGGLDTQGTIEFLRSQPPGSLILGVSHDFHLARIKLAAGLAGLHVVTVPAETDKPLPGRNRLLLRETAAFWFYFLRGLSA